MAALNRAFRTFPSVAGARISAFHVQKHTVFAIFWSFKAQSDKVRVQSATQWTASVHTLHMSKPNVTRVQSATQWTASGTYFTHIQT